MFYEILQKKLKNSSNWSSLKDFFMGHVEIRFLHGPCGNQISAWAMWKSDFFSLVQMNFTIFLKMYGNFSMTIAYTNSYRNIYLKGSTYSQFCIFTDFLTNLCLNIFLLLSLSKQSDSRLKTKPYYFFRGNYLRSGCNRSDLSYQYQRRKWRRCRWFWGQKSILWLSWMPKNVQKYCDELFLLEPQVSQKFWYMICIPLSKFILASFQYSKAMEMLHDSGPTNEKIKPTKIWASRTDETSSRPAHSACDSTLWKCRLQAHLSSWPDELEPTNHLV